MAMFSAFSLHTLVVELGACHFIKYTAKSLVGYARWGYYTTVAASNDPETQEPFAAACSPHYLAVHLELRQCKTFKVHGNDVRDAACGVVLPFNSAVGMETWSPFFSSPCQTILRGVP